MKITKKAGLSKSLPKIIREVQSSALRVGWSENQKYPDGEYVAGIAAQNEFGNPSKHIPPRPFVRPAISENEGNWKRQIAGGMKMVFSEKITTSGVFDAIGILVKADIQKSIASITSPPLAKSTIRARLKNKKVGNMATATKPLVDTGYMMATIIHEEVKK